MLRCARNCLIDGSINRQWLEERGQEELLDKLGERRIEQMIEDERASRAQPTLPAISEGGDDAPLVPGRALVDERDEQYAQDLSLWENRKLVERMSYVRNQHIARVAKRKAGYACQICGDHLDSPAMSRRYVHAHHIQPLSEGGPDEESNMVVVCPACHGRIHAGEIKVASAGDDRVVVNRAGEEAVLANTDDRVSLPERRAEAAYDRIVELVERLSEEQRGKLVAHLSGAAN